MGRTLVRLIFDAGDLQLVGAGTEQGHESVGADAGRVAGIDSVGVAITDDPAAAVAAADVAIDFTLPAAARGNIAACLQNEVRLVIGTTGLSTDDHESLAAAGRKIAIVYGRNMSVGVNVITELARLASRALGETYDAEVSDAHHRHKVDAPSGTALQLGEAIAAGRGVSLESVACYDRQTQDSVRVPGSIGFASVRAGSIVGDHTVLLANDEEIIELRHRAVDRSVFARGALRAAGWVAAQAPGLYSMNDVLGLQER